MRAAQLVAPGRFEFGYAPLPEPGPGHVRVRLHGCGVCASSLPLFEGRDWFTYPQPHGGPGHEGWGVVDALGAAVAESHPELQPGTPVGILSYHAFADYDLADADNLVVLPQQLAGKPFPAEALGCVMNIMLRAGVRQGDTVAIVGIGFLGGLLVQLCKAAGAHVIAVSRRAFSLELAAKCGADDLVSMDDHYRIIEQVKTLTNGRFCDVTIECTGLEWPLNLAGELTAERGRLVIAGYHQDGLRAVNVQLWNWRGLDVINAHEREPRRYRDGMQLAAAAVASGLLRPELLYTHQFHVDELQTAFEFLRDRPDGFVKGVIRNFN